MPDEEPSPEFKHLVMTQEEWNPYYGYSEWVPPLFPLLLLAAFFHARRVAVAMSLFLVGAAGIWGGYLYGRAGEHTLEVLERSAITEGDRNWIVTHDTLIMMPVEGFVRGAWRAFLVTGALWLCHGLALAVFGRARANPSNPGAD